MQLFYSSYFLKGKQERHSQEGALIKVSKNGFSGVADLAPKPQLGDGKLEMELADRGPLFTRALELATEDLHARTNGISLLQNKFLSNNLLVTDLDNFEIAMAKTLKVKGDSDFTRLLNWIKAANKIRIDFNNGLTSDKFEQFLKLLTPEMINKIEYIEDPVHINDKWAEWNRIVPLAYDLQKNSEYNLNLADFRIIKPSRQKLPADMKNVTLTSAMDHPVGVAHGLRIAQNVAVKDSGFLTLGLFEATGYEKYFVQKDTELNFSDLALRDTGIGMTAELNKLEWNVL